MEKHYYADSLDDVFKNITGTKCPMCDVVDADSNVALKRHFDIRHYKHAIFYEIDGKKVCILSCRKACNFYRKSEKEKNRGHFHCPFCEQIYGRSASFRHHLMRTQGNCSKQMEGKAFRSNDVSHNIIFVKEVEKYEELYNTSFDGYQDKEAQELAWSAIAGVVNEDEEQCKARWKRLKGSYYQYLKYRSDKTRYTPKYYLSEHMKFIIPYLKKNILTFPPTIEIVTDGDLEDMRTAPGQVEINTDSSAIANLSDIVNTEMLPWKRALDESQDSTFYDEVSSKRPRYMDTLDPDMAFFASLLPDLKKMTNRQKSRFKRYTIGVIEDILYGSPPENDAVLPSLGTNFVANM